MVLLRNYKEIVGVINTHGQLHRTTILLDFI